MIEKIAAKSDFVFMYEFQTRDDHQYHVIGWAMLVNGKIHALPKAYLVGKFDIDFMLEDCKRGHSSNYDILEEAIKGEEINAFPHVEFRDGFAFWKDQMVHIPEGDLERSQLETEINALEPAFTIFQNEHELKAHLLSNLN